MIFHDILKWYKQNFEVLNSQAGLEQEFTSMSQGKHKTLVWLSL